MVISGLISVTGPSSVGATPPQLSTVPLRKRNAHPFRGRDRATAPGHRARALGDGLRRRSGRGRVREQPRALRRGVPRPHRRRRARDRGRGRMARGAPDERAADVRDAAPRDPREVLNTGLLFLVASVVLVEGVRRLSEASEVASGGVLAVAAVGLASNALSL